MNSQQQKGLATASKFGANDPFMTQSKLPGFATDSHGSLGKAVSTLHLAYLKTTGVFVYVLLKRILRTISEKVRSNPCAVDLKDNLLFFIFFPRRGCMTRGRILLISSHGRHYTRADLITVSGKPRCFGFCSAF